MGTAEIEKEELIIQSHIFTYGNAANAALTEQMRDEIETMWNEPQAIVKVGGHSLLIRFKITAQFYPEIKDIDIYQNTDPRNNYFRIEEFVIGNISFVDGLGCNSGFFKLENLYKGSTTAAHEYGHTLGLNHPTDIDLRGKGVPGIMYPRGTLVDPQFQYDSSIPAGATGGTMHPMYRKVLPADIASLHIERLNYSFGKAILGDFTNYWHSEHENIS